MNRRSLLTAALSAPTVALAGSLPVVVGATFAARLIANHADAHAAFKRAAQARKKRYAPNFLNLTLFWHE